MLFKFQVKTHQSAMKFGLVAGCSTGNLNRGTRQKMVSENQIGAKNRERTGVGGAGRVRRGA